MATASYKGKYKPQNKDKYLGNPDRVVYRSNWERRFMVYCDRNEGITHWGSEEIAIRYRNPVTKKLHNYFPDFFIVTNKGKYIIEIKPKAFTKKPKPRARKTRAYINESLAYIKNRAKWGAAVRYCEMQGWEFKIFTEDDLGKF
jgi:hypothetical protein